MTLFVPLSPNIQTVGWSVFSLDILFRIIVRQKYMFTITASKCLSLASIGAKFCNWKDDINGSNYTP